MIRHCKKCQKTFRVDEIEQEWTRNQGLSLPRLCASCRAERRGLVSEERECNRCKTTFILPAEFLLLATTMGWKLPKDCITGCAGGKGPASFRGERKKTALFWERMLMPIEVSSSEGGQAKSADLSNLFSGLDAMLERAAEDEATAKAKTATEPTTSDDGDGVGGPPEPRGFAGDDVPSPDELFKKLGKARRKTSTG